MRSNSSPATGKKSNYGDPRLPLAVWAKITPADGCWIWQGRLDADGYGRLSLHGVPWLVHRLVFYALVSREIDGLHVHHRCETKACANPDHLESLTPSEHSKHHFEPRTATLKQCRRGHAFDEENAGIRPDGQRYCRACKRAANRRYSERTRPAPRSKLSNSAFILAVRCLNAAIPGNRAATLHAINTMTDRSSPVTIARLKRLGLPRNPRGSLRVRTMPAVTSAPSGRPVGPVDVQALTPRTVEVLWALRMTEAVGGLSVAAVARSLEISDQRVRVNMARCTTRHVGGDDA